MASLLDFLQEITVRNLVFILVIAAVDIPALPFAFFLFLLLLKLQPDDKRAALDTKHTDINSFEREFLASVLFENLEFIHFLVAFEVVVLVWLLASERGEEF